MNTNWETNLYCVIGDPISKSLSPEIHNYFFRLNHLNNIYLAFSVADNDLEAVLKSFKAIDVKGFNVTIPHKIKIINYLDEISKEAKILNAVNTVKNENGKLIGYNTDGMGFIKSLLDKGIEVENSSFLIVGAGGAAYAISMTLAFKGAKKIIILNRTEKKAKYLAEKIKTNFENIEVCYGSLYEELGVWAYVDIVVNCTPVGMYPNENDMPIDVKYFNKKTTIYDIVYKPLKTKFLKEAELKGFSTINGIDMLINQAILSQQIWNNVDGKNVEKSMKKIKEILIK